MTPTQVIEQAIDAFQNCVSKLESQHFRNPIQIPPVYGDIINAGFAAITNLRALLADMKKQEPVTIGAEWKPCVKLPIVVHVREQREGETHVSTREGITPVKPDDLIMRGVAGEEYPIGRELFNRTYTFDTSPPLPQREGWQWVPVEATPKMVDATWDEPIGVVESHNSRNKRIYKAMLQAAPKPTEGE